MIRQLILTVTSLAALVAAANTTEARDFFARQVDPALAIESLPTPAALSRQGRFVPAQKIPYQAVQKMPYQTVQKMPYYPAQKGVYQKSVLATRVRYVQHCPHRKTCCGCGSSYQTILTVIDPVTCCPIDVPVCLPTCCTGQPASSGRKGLLVRGVTSYSWCCGYTVRIVVGHHGNVVVHYYGV